MKVRRQWDSWEKYWVCFSKIMRLEIVSGGRWLWSSGLHCLHWGGGKHLSTGPELTVNSDKPPASCPVSQQFYPTQSGKYGDEINDILFKRYNLILNNFQRPRAVTIMICLSEVSPLLGPVTPHQSVCGMWGSTMVATHPAMFYWDLTLAGTDNNTIITGTASSLLSPLSWPVVPWLWPV